MTLQTLSPAPDWDPAAHPDTVDTLSALGEDDQVLVWCDDGCRDCRAMLPDFAAALEAAAVPPDQIVQYPVERLSEGRKQGPNVDEYGIERIPTVVIERDGVEFARFVEGDEEPIAETLATQLASGNTGQGG